MRACCRIAIAAAMLALAPTLSAAPAMRVALLIDTSAATAASMVQIRTAVGAFLDSLPPEHEVLLVTTGRRAQVRVPPTSDRAKLKSNAAGLTSDSGPTALMDALVEVDERFMRKASGRWPVFVIVTGDGSENSKDTEEQGFNHWVTDIVKRGVEVNAVVLKSASIGLPDNIASMLVRATQGHYSSMSPPATTLPSTLTLLADQLAADAGKRP